MVAGESAGIKKETAGQMVTQHSITEDHKRRVRILLAEDNVINQKIALRVLEKKLGHHVDLAVNGREVVDSLEKSDYDLGTDGLSDAENGWIRSCTNHT